jgi:hypothetical protein
MPAGLIFARGRILAELRDRLAHVDRQLSGLHPERDAHAIERLRAVRDRTIDDIKRVEDERVQKPG